MSECPHGYETEARCPFCRRANPQRVTVIGTSDWNSAAKHALWELAGSGRPFTSEDLTDIVGLPNDSRPNGNNGVGAFINAHAKRYGLRRTDMAKARNPQAHGRLLAVWVGRVGR